MKKQKISLSEEQIKSMFKKTPSVLTSIIAFFMMIYTVLVSVTTFLVITKLMIMAWGWLL